MQPTTPHRKRIASGLVFLLHLLVVGLTPLADAYLEAASREVNYVHVESEREEPCAPSHDHLFCQVCRVVEHTTVPGGASPILEIASSSGYSLPDAAVAHLPGRSLLSSLAPRAPPSA